MATATVPRPVPPGIVLEDVPWADYEAMLRIVGDRHIRINYDRRRMEIMSPLKRHGDGSYLLGRMVDTLTEELNIPVEHADPVTLRRPDLEKGVEPDKLYHFGANAERVRGAREFDLAVDPPPDLVIEVDVTSSSIPRLPIFAAMGIPEVWRIDGEDLQFLHLQAEGTYQPRDHSRAFPTLPLAEAARFLELGQRSDKNTWIRSFRVYVRDNLAPRDERPAGPG
jgi:Uma2 family endonuclease